MRLRVTKRKAAGAADSKSRHYVIVRGIKQHSTNNCFFVWPVNFFLFGPNHLILQSITLFMVALWNRADHYIFALWLLSFLISSPNLSGRRLDVYHTSTHGVALVRI